MIRDGSGVEIANEVFTNALDTYEPGMGTVMFDLAPSSNPISVVITSLAGNGLPEVADAPRLVTCESLSGGQPQTHSTRPEIVTTTSTRPAPTTTRPATTSTSQPTTSTTVAAPSTVPSSTAAPTTAAPVPSTPAPGPAAPGVGAGGGTATPARPIAANANYTG